MNVTCGYQFVNHYYGVNEYDLTKIYLEKFILRVSDSGNVCMNLEKSGMSKTLPSNHRVTSSTSFHTPTTPLTDVLSTSGRDGNNTLLEFPKLNQQIQNSNVSTTTNETSSSPIQREGATASTASGTRYESSSFVRRPQHNFSEQPPFSSVIIGTQQDKTKTTPIVTNFDERVSDQLLNCLSIQTNVIKNLTQYSQHISLQLSEIKNTVEMLCNRVSIQQQQQQQQHVPQQPVYPYPTSQNVYNQPQLAQYQQHIRQPFLSTIPSMQPSPPLSISAFPSFSTQPPFAGVYQIPAITPQPPSNGSLYHQTYSIYPPQSNQFGVLKPSQTFEVYPTQSPLATSVSSIGTTTTTIFPGQGMPVFGSTPKKNDSVHMPDENDEDVDESEKPY
ncbi:unnamed protein product, partial [Didymodactylos carnosus]